MPPRGPVRTQKAQRKHEREVKRGTTHKVAQSAPVRGPSRARVQAEARTGNKPTVRVRLKSNRQAARTVERRSAQKKQRLERKASRATKQLNRQRIQVPTKDNYPLGGVGKFLLEPGGVGKTRSSVDKELTKSGKRLGDAHVLPRSQKESDELLGRYDNNLVGGPGAVLKGAKAGLAGIKGATKGGVKETAKRAPKVVVKRVKTAPARTRKAFKEHPVKSSAKAAAHTSGAGVGVVGLSTGNMSPEEAATWALTPAGLKVAGKAGKGARTVVRKGAQKVGKAAAKKPAIRRLAGERGSMRLAGTAGPRTHKQRRVIRAAKTAAIGGALASEPHSRLFIKRHAEATADNPKKVLGTTLRSIPSIITAPAAVAVSAGVSGGRAVTGHKKPLEPVKATADSFIDFNKKLASLGSEKTSNAKARKIIQDETGLTGPMMAAPIIARGIRTKRAGEKAPTSRETGKIGRVAGLRIARRSKERREVARTISKERTRSQAEQGRHAQETAHPTEMGPELSVAAVVAEHGSYAKAKEHADRQPRVETDEGITIHDVIDYAEANPKVFESKAYKEGLEGYRAGKGRQHQEGRARYAQVVLASGGKGTEARAAARKKASKDAKKAESKAKGELRKAVADERVVAAQATGQAKPATAKKRAAKTGEALTPKQKARQAQARARTVKAAIAYKAAKAERIAASRAANPRRAKREVRQEFIKEGKDIVAKEGLDEPVILRHTDVDKIDTTPVDSGTRMTQTSKAIHGRRTDEGGLAARGRVDYSPEAAMESLNVPSRVSAIHRATASVVDSAKLGFGVRKPEPGSKPAKYRKKGEPEEATVGTLEDARAAVGEGKRYNPDDVRIVPVRMFGWAMKDKNAKLLDDAVEISRKDTADALNDLQGTGERVMILERHKWDELVNGVTRRSKGAQRGQGISRGISKGILYTYAWALAQGVAAAAVGRAHVPFNKQVRGKRALNKTDPVTQDVFGAEAGKVPGGAGTSYERLTTKPETAGKVIGGARKKWDDLDKTRAGRNAKRIIDSPSAFNKWSEGAIRAGVSTGHALKEVKGLTSQFGEVARMHSEFHKAMKGKTDAEVLEAVARNPKVMATLSRKTEKMMGDFATLTHREQAIAPFLIFYPFMRYSVKFVTHGLPAAHPLKAALFYDFAQWNSNELKKFLGNDPPFFADWAGLPIRTGKGKEGIAGTVSTSRIAPGGGYFAESLGEVANTEKGWPALRALNPVVASLWALGSNVDPLTGKQLKKEGTDDPLTGITGPGAKLAASVVLGSLSPTRAVALVADLDRKNLLTKKDRTALVALNEKLRPSKPVGAFQRFVSPVTWQEKDKARDLAVVSAAFKLIDKSDEASEKKGRKLLDSMYKKHGLLAQSEKETDAFFAKKYGGNRKRSGGSKATTPEGQARARLGLNSKDAALKRLGVK